MSDDYREDFGDNEPCFCCITLEKEKRYLPLLNVKGPDLSYEEWLDSALAIARGFGITDITVSKSEKNPGVHTFYFNDQIDCWRFELITLGNETAQPGEEILFCLEPDDDASFMLPAYKEALEYFFDSHNIKDPTVDELNNRQLRIIIGKAVDYLQVAAAISDGRLRNFAIKIAAHNETGGPVLYNFPSRENMGYEEIFTRNAQENMKPNGYALPVSVNLQSLKTENRHAWLKEKTSYARALGINDVYIKERDSDKDIYDFYCRSATDAARFRMIAFGDYAHTANIPPVPLMLFEDEPDSMLDSYEEAIRTFCAEARIRDEDFDITRQKVLQPAQKIRPYLSVSFKRHSHLATYIAAISECTIRDMAYNHFVSFAQDARPAPVWTPSNI